MDLRDNFTQDGDALMMQALDILTNLAQAQLVCVGDVMLDRFIEGSVGRISPEAPIPVLKVTEERMMLGGAGNVVRNLGALRVQSSFISVIGSDETGHRLTELMGQEQAVLPDLILQPGRETSVKTRYLAAGQQLIRVDQESVADISAESRACLFEAVKAALVSAGALILSDYGKGVLSNDILSDLIYLAKEAKVPVIVDPKGKDYRCYHGADLLTPNQRELADATDTDYEQLLASESCLLQAARSLIAECEIGAVLVTRSEKGMTLVRKDHDPVHLGTRAQEVFDVSGAGDTVVAGFAAALAAGASYEIAMEIANVAAGIVVGKIGTAVASHDEIRSYLRHQGDYAGQSKILPFVSAEEVDQSGWPLHLQDRLETWRRQNYRVGFTNGCFDLVHPGHISLLSQARAQCDRLIIGLNSDASIKRLKGDSRPVQSLDARAQVLAAIAAVDLVVPFDQDTPQALIEEIIPDVLVKGADYTVETVVGADIVQANGGIVFLADLTEGQSTSSMIARASS